MLDFGISHGELVERKVQLVYMSSHINPYNFVLTHIESKGITHSPHYGHDVFVASFTHKT